MDIKTLAVVTAFATACGIPPTKSSAQPVAAVPHFDSTHALAVVSSAATSNTTELTLLFSETPLTCDDVRSDIPFETLSVSLRRAQDEAWAPLELGRYDVIANDVIPSGAAVDNGNWAFGGLHAPQQSPASTLAGFVDISALDVSLSGNVTGAFAIDFSGGTQQQGTFVARICHL